MGFNTKSSTSSWTVLLKSKLSDYQLLTKLRLTGLVVFSACIAFAMGIKGQFDIVGLLWLCLAGFFVTGAANALNQVLEKDYDRLMARTADRPLATGRMEPQEAVLAAGIMSVLGILIFALVFNPIAAILSSLSLILYAFVYTPMKRVSPVSVWIGAIPGALPMMIGWVAATGELNVQAWVLFSIQFFWQFPHFWAIGWLGYDDYQKAGFKMLPSVEGRDRQTALQCILYALMLIPVAFLPWWFGMTGVLAVGITLVVTAIYCWYAFMLYRNLDNASARKLLFSSFLYLPVTLIALLIDKI